MADTTATSISQYPVGSKEWIEAHRTRTGAYHVTGQDIKMLMQDPKWREGYKRYKLAVLHLNTILEKKRGEAYCKRE